MEKLFSCLIILAAAVLLVPGCFAEETSNTAEINVTEAAPMGESANATDAVAVHTAWTGTWNSGNETVTILTQNESSVNGTFEESDGSKSILEGSLSEDGKVLSGIWTESGKLSLTLSEDGKAFNGTYGFGSGDSVEADFDDSWNGIRADNQTSEESAWTGLWDSGNDMVTILAQNESTVTGTFERSGVVETVLEGNLSEDGKVLSGIWTESGKLSLTLSEDGKVFNGTYGFGSSDSMEGDLNDSWNGIKGE